MKEYNRVKSFHQMLPLPIRPGRWDLIFRALGIAGVLEIIALIGTLIAHPDTSGLIGQGLFFRIWFGLIIAPAILCVGMLGVWRVPGNLVGRFLILIALGDIAAQFHIDLGAPIPTALAVEVIILLDTGLVGPCLGYLMLTFPAGRIYPPGLTRITIIVAVIKFIGVLLEILASPGEIKIFAPTFNPLSLPALYPFRAAISWTIGITGLLMPLIIFSGLFSLILRYRAAPALQRQQIKWVMWGFCLLVPTGMAAFWLVLQYGYSQVPFHIAYVFAGFAQVLFLASIAIAILRYRLFVIDILINRTLVYGLLTLIIAGVYVLAVGYLSELFHESGSFILSLLATGLIAVLFQPLRDRLQRTVNRLMYGEWDDPYAILSRLSQQLKETFVPETVLPKIVETIAQTLKLPYVAIALKQELDEGIAIEFGLNPVKNNPRIKNEVFPLEYQSERIGELILAPREKNELFTPAERKLLAGIADQSALAAYTVRLLNDLRLSRQRLITAREEERRHLRRELHDGLGSILASLSFNLDAASNLLDRDPAATGLLLKELKLEIQTAMSDIRRLAYDLRPPVLDELGFVASLQEYIKGVNRPPDLCIEFNSSIESGNLPAAIEVAAYRISVEALKNVIRHARAHHCIVNVTMKTLNSMQVEVIDDGQGLPMGWHAGVGISAMRERAFELGGSFDIQPNVGGGTRVIARFPLSKE